MPERVLTHATSDPPAGGCGARDITAIAHMRSAACLVRTHVIGAENDALLFGDERLLFGRHPVGQRFGFAHAWVERVCRALADDGKDDGSDRRSIPGFGFPDMEHR